MYSKSLASPCYMNRDFLVAQEPFLYNESGFFLPVSQGYFYRYGSLAW